MKFTIQRGAYEAVVSSRGAELVSLKKNGREYLWQGKEGVWNDHCYNIFPFAGRLQGDEYRLFGKTYQMPLHGFGLYSEFTEVEVRGDSVTLRLEENAETLARWPYRFCYTVMFMLTECGLLVKYAVENRDDKTMYCAFGAHPGFLLPNPISEYELEFGGKTTRLPLDESRLLTGERVPLTGRTLKLTEGAFMPAHIYETASHAKLKGPDRSVTLRFSDFDYLVIWSGDEHLICIEPWGSVTETADRKEELQNRKDMIALESGETAAREWSVEL